MEYPGNSNNSKASPPQDDIKPVVTGGVRLQKKPLTRRFAETFLSGRSPREIMLDVIHNVLIPAGQDAIRDTAQEALDQTLGRRSSGRRARPSGSSTTFVNYNRPSGVNYQAVTSSAPQASMTQRARREHDFKEFVFDQRVKAQEVLEQLYDRLEKFERVTVRDLYALVGQSASYTDSVYGWTTLQGSGVLPRSGGYILDLPPTQKLS